MTWPLVTVSIGLAVGLLYYVKNAYSYWSRKGVRGPEPWPFVGNLGQLLYRNRMTTQNEWVKKYGKVYGIYRGMRPNLVVADAEVLQQICVKDFDAFTNHDVSEFLNDYQKSFLFLLQDEHWKRARALMSPTFTSGKIKRMFRLLDACADDLISCFDEQLADKNDRKALVNVKDTFNLFTFDSITTCCYGLKMERASGSSDLKSAASRNDFVRMIMNLFNLNMWRLFIASTAYKPLLRLLKFSANDIAEFYAPINRVKQLVDKRRKSGKKHDDYLQLLIDAKLDDELELNEMDSQENHHAGLTQESLRQDQQMLVSDIVKNTDGPSTTPASKQVLSEHEIVSGALFLMIVGLETTSSLLTHCSHLLALNPEVQEKLHDEVMKIVEHKEADKSKTYFSYEALTTCQYLDAVISETLRIFTPVFTLDRASGKDYHIEKYNLTIPRGTLVSTAFYAIMNNPEYWPEPQKFDPERFMPGNKEKIVPGSYCPFGLGPRHCIGMRFSLTEAKLALAKIVMKYRFEPAPGAQFPPVLNRRLDLASPKDPTVYVIPRE